MNFTIAPSNNIPLFLGAAVVAEPVVSNWTVGQTVKTTSGPVIGHDAGNSTAVSEYLGIPFAQPPVGNLRFAPPQKFSGSATVNAGSYGFSCPIKPPTTQEPSAEQLKAANATAQLPLVEDILTDTVGNHSEDCLYLNVWAKPQVGEQKKAVLVWIYGGAFSVGSASIQGYNGRNLAALEDVIVVSFNYRTNIFGFPGQPDEAKNVGLLDQRLALEWVRDNIANFGGDPQRITFFGQSAGGASIDLYSYAYASDPIVVGLIPQSGTAFSWGLPTPTNTTATSWFQVSQNLGCGNSSSDSSAILSCMRSKNTSQIYNAFPPATALSAILGLFQPTVDDKVVFSNYTGRKPANIPLLLGSNDYEAGLFRTELAVQGIILQDSFWDTFNVQEFTCPSGIRANISLASKNPTWRYRYMGIWPNLELTPQAGAWHGSEIPMLFNIMPASPPVTTAQISIADYMRGAWVAFAKDPKNGLTRYGWPSYDPAQDTLVRIGNNNITGPNLINQYRYDADCPFVNISSLDATKFKPLPHLGANVTPTGMNGGNPTATATARSTQSPSPTESTRNSSTQLDLSFWSIFAVVAALAWCL